MKVVVSTSNNLEFLGLVKEKSKNNTLKDETIEYELVFNSSQFDAIAEYTFERCTFNTVKLNNCPKFKFIDCKFKNLHVENRSQYESGLIIIKNHRRVDMYTIDNLSLVNSANVEIDNVIIKEISAGPVYGENPYGS